MNAIFLLIVRFHAFPFPIGLDWSLSKLMIAKFDHFENNKSHFMIISSKNKALCDQYNGLSIKNKGY
ncbi:MAG: hypothetical protein WCL14_11800 [Bacteroidota bacterium]